MTECPLVYAGHDTFDALAFVDLATQGVLPLAGGALDQTQMFLDVLRFVSSERAHWLNRRTSNA